MGRTGRSDATHRGDGAGRRGDTLLSRALRARTDVAVIDAGGSFTYGDLAKSAAGVARQLLGGRQDLEEARVAVMVPPGLRFVGAQWGTWAAGGVSVPLCLTHPAPELEYVIDDAAVSAVVAATEYHPVLEPIVRARDLTLLDVGELGAHGEEVAVPAAFGTERRALILYTSGSTGRPKGVVWTHGNLEAQLRALSDAWEWRRTDRALLVLPLHHVHGLVNVVTSALWNGAACDMLERFDAGAVWQKLMTGTVTVLMAVPTIYRRLITAWEDADATTRRRMSQAASDLRLMVSGSAALPVPTLDRWREISGHTLLERYGMTEIGMALSNPYGGNRVPGTVGMPLPTVELRLVDDVGRPVTSGAPGEIEVKGPSVFAEYWRRPEATAGAFRDGWFRTGDDAVFDGTAYRILGRRSVDIIKTGGEKVSALEIEDVLRTHPGVQDCAVVGIPDAEWGEQVVVAVVAAGDAGLELADLQAFARQRLAPYKVPRGLQVVEALPRNALGKVVKPQVKDLFAPASG